MPPCFFGYYTRISQVDRSEECKQKYQKIDAKLKIGDQGFAV